MEAPKLMDEVEIRIVDGEAEVNPEVPSKVETEELVPNNQILEIPEVPITKPSQELLLAPVKKSTQEFLKVPSEGKPTQRDSESAHSSVKDLPQTITIP